jgi:hypothetical protein
MYLSGNRLIYFAGENVVQKYFIRILLIFFSFGDQQKMNATQPISGNHGNKFPLSNKI